MRRYCLFVLLCFLPMAVVQAKSGEDEVSSYERRLVKAISVAKQYFDAVSPTPEQTTRFQGVLRDLEGYALEYPQSVYADDARCIALMFDFIDAMVSQKKDLVALLVNDFQDFLDNYPGGKIEDYTIEKSIRIISDYVASAYLYLSYPDMFLFLKGWTAWSFGNYEQVIDYYTELKDHLSFRRDKGGYLAYDIYNTLIESYAQLGRYRDASELAQEAMKRFPDNRDLRRSVKRFAIMEIGRAHV